MRERANEIHRDLDCDSDELLSVIWRFAQNSFLLTFSISQKYSVDVAFLIDPLVDPVDKVRRSDVNAHRVGTAAREWWTPRNDSDDVELEYFMFVLKAKLWVIKGDEELETLKF